MQRFAALTLVLVTTLMAGCAGYRLGGQKPAHLQRITKLAVPAFENRTLEPRLGALVTNAVIKEIQMHGGYEIVSRDEAEAVLLGSVSNIRRSQFRSDRTNVLRTSQLLMTLGTQFTVVESGSGAVIHKGQLAADSYVILDRNIQNSEAQALENAAQRLAASLASEIGEGW